MKFKRFMFKVLRLKVIIPIIIVIVAGALLLAYFFGGVKASAVETNNLSFNFSDFESYEEKEFTDAGIASGEYRKWVAQTDDYVMYFDEATTICYVYEIEPYAMTSDPQLDEDGNETGYNHIDISLCDTVYTTASSGDTKTDAGANFIISYADGKTGNKVSEELNTMTNSVHYKNDLTEEIEHHYFVNEVEDGVQVLYAVGKFSAVEKYFPKYFYQTIYKPFKGVVDGEPMLGSYADPELDEDEQAVMDANWATANEYWVKYMQMLGVEDPENADYWTIQCALEQTYEQRFRGNALFKMSKPDKTHPWKYTGVVRVYTEEAYVYMMQHENEFQFSDIKFGYEQASSASKYFTLGNAYWEFKDVDLSFFEGEGVYFNCADSPIIVNTAIPSRFFESDFGCGNTGSGYTVTSNETNPFRFYERKGMNAFVKTSIFNMLYKTDNVWEDSLDHYPYLNSDEEETICGGILKFEKTDEDPIGHYVFGTDGKIEKRAYTVEDALADNALFDVEVETNLPVFAFAAEFKLTKNGLETTVLADSLVDSRNAEDSDIIIKVSGLDTKISDLNKKYEYLTLTVLPQMTTTVSTKEDPVKGDEGYILIPDGSGAIINFGNGKYELGYEGVNKMYYGSDYAFATKAQPEDTKDLMLGMFGYVCTTTGRERGVIGIIEEGGNQNSLAANTDRYKNYAYFKLVISRTQEVRIGTGSGGKPFYKLAEKMTDTDARYLYMFLEANELDYSSIAKKYQGYLIERDYGEGKTLADVEKDKTTDTVVDLNFLGSFEKYALFLGFKYKTADSLTTFDQAEEIINELKTGVEVTDSATGTVSTKKITDYSVTYTAWTNEEMEYQVGGSISVNGVLGGKSGLKDFANFLAKDEKSIYLETKITSTKGFDYTFGKLKYSARNVANEVAMIYGYNPSTLRQDKKLSATNYINPLFYATIAEEVAGKTNKIGKSINNTLGYYLNDLGNLTVNSYKAGEEVYGGMTVNYQKAAIEELTKEGNSIKIEAPYDYVFKYVNEATNIPLISTKAPIYDETIPFYQLVISGLFDYTTEDINGTSNKSANWYYAKAIETGSNLSFVISAENPNVLLDTDYTYYYQSYYQNWKEIIVDFTSKINELGIHQGQLVYHKFITQDIAFVQYKNYKTSELITLCVNSTQNDYTVKSPLTINGITISANTVIPGYGYYKLG